MRKGIRMSAAVAVSVGGLWWALHGLDAAALKRAWAQARAPWLLLLVPVSGGVDFLARSVRWGLLVPRKSRPSVGRLFQITAGGLFLNNLLPFRAGEAARLFWTHRETGEPLAACAAVLGADRVFDMASLAILFLWVMSRWPGFPGAGRLVLLLGGATCIGLSFLWLVARHPERAEEWAARLGARERLRRSVAQFARGAAPLADARLSSALLLLSLFFWSANAALLAVASRIFGLGLSMTEAVALILAFCAGAALPSAPGAVGTLEAAGVAFLTAARREPAPSAAFVLTLHAAQMLSSVLYGAPSLSLLTGGEKYG